MAKGDKQRLSQRSMWLMVILGLGFLLIILRLGYLQLFQNETLSKMAIEQQLKDTTLSARRGAIYDKNGKVLAESASVWRVIISPLNFEDDEERTIVAKGLAEILGMKEADIFEKTKSKSGGVDVKRKIENDTRDKILNFIDKLEEEHNITGVINLVEDYKRYYPDGDFASSVLGVTGSDCQGLSGLELQYEDQLTGTPGRIITAQNAVGGKMPYDFEQMDEPKDGNSLVLTIDSNIQSIMEKYLEQEIKKDKVANRAVAVMMDVNTGAILGMAVEGGFDLNNAFSILDAKKKEDIDKMPAGKEKNEAVNDALARQWRNKAVSDTYYPGSVFKIITSAIAMQENVLPENWQFTCTGSLPRPGGGKSISCHKDGGHGTQNFFQALCNSCNPGFMTIGKEIGKERFWEYYQKFGFSEDTGIDLPDEGSDIFFAQGGVVGQMSDVDLAVGSFGQNFAITPIQLVTAVAAVANGGELVTPYLVSKIVDSDGNVVMSRDKTVRRQVVSKEVSEQLCSMLEENAISGGAKNGYVAGYRIAGKTGTTEKKKDENGDGADDYIASFCGFGPSDKPEVVMLVYFDTPTSGNYYGSQVAAPCFAQIMEEVLPYLQIETQYSDDEIANLDTQAGSYIGKTFNEAENEIESAGMLAVTKGSGDKVIRQIPEAGAKVPKGGTIVIFTDDASVSGTVTVPKLTGLSLTEANRIASMYDLNISISGASASGGNVSNTQDIAEGTKVSPGSVITLTFVNDSADNNIR